MKINLIEKSKKEEFVVGDYFVFNDPYAGYSLRQICHINGKYYAYIINTGRVATLVGYNTISDLLNAYTKIYKAEVEINASF